MLRPWFSGALMSHRTSGGAACFHAWIWVPVPTPQQCRVALGVRMVERTSQSHGKATDSCF